MVDRIEVSRRVPAPPEDVAGLFWDIERWQRIWYPINEISVPYDDGVHQEFRMFVERDGRIEDVRTIRFRDGADIVFFSPVPPPMMAVHRGRWDFAPDGGGCVVRAVREYELLCGADEDAPGFAARRADFDRSFAERLGRILDSFAAHYGKPADAP